MDKEIIIANETDVDVEKIDFSFPEDVLIEVKLSSKPYDRGWLIMSTTVISDNPVMGAASYQIAYAGLFHYMLKDILEPILKEGFYVVLGVTADITQGDGWTTDDDIEIYYQSVREATPDEIALG